MEKKIIDLAKEKLTEGGYTCVLTDGKDFYCSELRGEKPLVRFIDRKSVPCGLYAADKVVGKATAYLYVILQIRALYAFVISEPALSVLDAYGIHVSYGTLVPNIINRRGDGICPFEEAVLSSASPEDAYSAILKKMIELNIDID